MLTEKQRAANERYIAANYKQIAIRWPADFAALVKETAEASGESLAGYIRKAIEMRMKHDNEESPV